jgi:hypothetical protein
MTLTDIKRPQAIAVFSKYIVYQVSSGVSVSRGTLCPMTPLPEELRARACQPGMWDAGPEDEGGGLALTGSVTESPYTPRASRAVRLGTKCRDAQIRERFCS